MPYVIHDTDGHPVTPDQARAIIAEHWTVPADICTPVAAAARYGPTSTEEPLAKPIPSRESDGENAGVDADVVGDASHVSRVAGQDCGRLATKVGYAIAAHRLRRACDQVPAGRLACTRVHAASRRRERATEASSDLYDDYDDYFPPTRQHLPDWEPGTHKAALIGFANGYRYGQLSAADRVRYMDEFAATVPSGSG